MKRETSQQIVVSGVGGQGVLLVTRLLAEAAMSLDLPVFTSETHGMAQRGGTVLSHLKVGDFHSPLIRPGQADGLLALKAENLAAHGAFLNPDGWTVVNAAGDLPGALDAEAIARDLGNPRAVNLILLGFALASKGKPGRPLLFCRTEDVDRAVQETLSERPKLMDGALAALAAGAAAASAAGAAFEMRDSK